MGDKFPAFLRGRLGSGPTEGTGPQPPSLSIHSALKVMAPQAGQDTSHRPGGAGSGQEAKPRCTWALPGCGVRKARGHRACLPSLLLSKRGLLQGST